VIYSKLLGTEMALSRVFVCFVIEKDPNPTVIGIKENLMKDY
jgi:hypothetical protein